MADAYAVVVICYWRHQTGIRVSKQRNMLGYSPGTLS